MHVTSLDGVLLPLEVLGARSRHKAPPEDSLPGELGSHALACALVERCGSLEAAWQFFGVEASGRLNYVQWTCGLSRLRLDVSQVCGVSAHSLFWKMSSHGGDVTPESWQAFFSACCEGSRAREALAEAARQYRCQQREARRGGSLGRLREEGGEAPQLLATSESPTRARRRYVPHASRAHEAEVATPGRGSSTPTPSSSSTGPPLRKHRASPARLRPCLSLAQELEREAGMSPEELAELDSQAVAEQAELQEELTGHNLTGIAALVFVFTAKLGSVKQAFHWLDSTRSGRLAHVEWDTGMRVLRIDLERLTGLNARGIFRTMDPDRRGEVRRTDWMEFFRQAVEGMPVNLLQCATNLASGSEGSLAERARRRREGGTPARGGRAGQPSGVDEGGGVGGSGSWSSSGGRRGGQGAGGGSGPGRGSGGSGSRNGEAACVDGALGADASTGAGTSAGAGATTAAAAAIASGVEEVSRGLCRRGGLGALSDEERRFRERVMQELSQLSKDERIEYSPEETPGGLGARRALVVEDAAEELGLLALDLRRDAAGARCGGTESPGVLVFDLAGFAEEVKAKLRAIPLGSSLEFPDTLTSVQRQVVHLLASGLGLWTQSEGKGPSRRVTAFNLGGLVDDIWQRLKALQPGESVAFPKDLTEVQRKVVHMVASGLQLWSYTEGSGDERHVEVFNLAAFAEQVRSELSLLKPGEQRSYPCTLSEKQRKVVHCIANELGLGHLSQDDGPERFVTVGNLQDFQSVARGELEALQPGETKMYEASLSALRRKCVHLLASELGFESKSSERGAEQQVAVTRPAEESKGGEKSGRLKRRNGMDIDEEVAESAQGEGESEVSQIESLFDAFATGSFNGRKVFIGFRDVAAFAEELREAMPEQHRRFRRLHEDLEQVFEDTLQLQIDFGTRTKKGLTLKWFQVFIQKVARQVGLSVMGVLLAVLGDIKA